VDHRTKESQSFDESRVKPEVVEGREKERIEKKRGIEKTWSGVIIKNALTIFDMQAVDLIDAFRPPTEKNVCSG
jgi:hypothetical protein